MARQRLKVQTSEPLTPEHLALLNRLLQSCAESDAYCEKCLSCGVEVTPEKRTNLEQQRTARAIKEQFFPGQP
jgi:hypothetical protein